MKPHPRAVVLLSIILAFAFWLADSCIHYFLYREPAFQLIPQDINELWMRMVIFLLILGMGVVFARIAVTGGQRTDTVGTHADSQGRAFDVAIVRLHMLARRVETNQLTPEEFYALARAAIQPAIDSLVTQK